MAMILVFTWKCINYFSIQDEIDNLKDYLEELDRSIDEYSDSVRNINGLVETNEDATRQNNTEDVTGILF